LQEQESRAGSATALRQKLDHGYLFAAYKKIKVRDDHGHEHHQLSTLDAFEHSTKVSGALAPSPASTWHGHTASTLLFVPLQVRVWHAATNSSPLCARP
jgi:hypothetical protein